jgi:hypothetical protein
MLSTGDAMTDMDSVNHARTIKAGITDHLKREYNPAYIRCTGIQVIREHRDDYDPDA